MAGRSIFSCPAASASNYHGGGVPSIITVNQGSQQSNEHALDPLPKPSVVGGFASGSRFHGGGVPSVITVNQGS